MGPRNHFRILFMRVLPPSGFLKRDPVSIVTHVIELDPCLPFSTDMAELQGTDFFFENRLLNDQRRPA